MSDVSYIRAAIACLPIVGPFASEINFEELEDDVQMLSMRFFCDQNARYEEQSKICRKGRIYAFCDIIGKVLSIAIIVGLVAFGILNMVYAIVPLAVLSYMTATSMTRLQRYVAT